MKEVSSAAAPRRVPKRARASASDFFLHDPPSEPAACRWHALAVLVLALLAPLTVRAWFDEDLLPSGDAAGYMSMVDHVRDSLLRYRRVPAWSTKWFAGSTHFMSSLKELATFPLALELGPVLATKAMFVVSKVAAALGMYSLFVRYFSAPLPGIIAGYAYGFGAPANHSNALFGHLDVAMSYALFPVILMASVELLRARRWRWAIALGVLVAGQLCIHYLHAIVCPLLLLVVLGLRPWRRTAHEDDPVADRALARRWGLLLGGSLVTFVLFAGSPLAWLVADRGNHALHSPEQVAQGVERYVEQSPFLYVNRNNWLGDWVERHRPPQMLFSAGDPDFNSRRYLGVVAIAVAAGGWLCARRRFSLRRWYQSFGLVFLLQYWLATGPRTPVWQIARSLHWADAVDGPVSAGLTLAAVGCLVWAILLVLRRRAPAVRVELAVGLALFLFLLSHSLFDLARGALPFLRVIRSPGHLFDLAPFTFYGLFGVGLVAITRATARASARHGLAAALGLAVVLDFWPSTHAFSRGTPLGRVREFRRVVSELPAEGGTLRLAMSPSSPTVWTAPSLVAAGSEVGTAWSWIFWQAGRYWGDYLRIATLPHVRRLTPETRERVREIGDVLCRIGRLKYLLEEVEFPSRLRMEAPWTRRAANPRFVLWERPDVMPMAYGYRSYVVAGGRADSAGTVFWAFQRELLVVSGEEHSSHVPPAVLDGAALVADEEPVEDAEERIARAPRGPLLPVDYRRPAPEHIVLRTDSGDAPAMIFLSESYHPWWQAVVDGRPAPLVRAQMVFMAVPVGPGPHLIELRLRRPLPVAAADWITAFAWLALPLAAAGGVLRRRTGRRTVSAPSALTRRFL